MLYREPKELNLISTPIYLLIILSIYGVWKYSPTYWEYEKIKSMVNDVVIDANRVGDGRLEEAIVRSMIREFGIAEFNHDSIEVRRDEDFVYVDLSYPATVEHPFNREHSFIISMSVRRRIVNL